MHSSRFSIKHHAKTTFALGLVAISLGATKSAQASVVYNPGFEKLKSKVALQFPLVKKPKVNPGQSGDDGSPSDPYPTHTVFFDQASAIQWAEGQAAELGQALGAKTFTVIDPSTDSRYTTLQAYLHDTWLAYLKLFPAVVGNLPEPQVILVNTEEVNALVMPDLSTGKIGHAIWVFSGLVDSSGGVTNRAVYTGLFGHELAHTVFRHLLPSYQQFYDRAYQPSAQPSAQFGYQATNDQRYTNALMSWENDASYVGDADWPELQNLPLGGSFEQVMYDLQNGQFSDPSQPCQQIHNDLPSLLNPGAAMSVVYGDYERADTSANITSNAQGLIGEMKACTTLSQNAAKHETIESMGLAATGGLSQVNSVFDSAGDTTSGLLAAVASIRQDMGSLEAGIQFPTLRHFTYEEHADSVSAVVNFQMQLDGTSPGPNALSTALSGLALAVGGDSGELSQCQSDVAAGKAPALGLPEDPHHGICYRLYNISRLAGAMSPANYTAFVADFLSRSTPPQGF